VRIAQRKISKDAIMAKKQIFAQFGVFLLLALNVAAYWFLWPNYHNVSSNEGKAQAQEKGTTQLTPIVPAKSAPPKEIPPTSLKNAVPLSIPKPGPQSESKGTSEQETISKLFDQIKKDNEHVTLPLVPMPLEVKPLAIDERPVAPNPLPMLPAEPLRIDDPAPVVGVAAVQTPTASPSPWQLSMEIIGTRTQLFAKLRQPGNSTIIAEFKITCDRVEMKAPGGELQALGKVTVVGAGLNATCNRLILPIHETRLIFEEQAQFAHEGVAGSMLRGDRIAWELPVNVVAPMNEFRPAGILPPALGLPK